MITTKEVIFNNLEKKDFFVSLSRLLLSTSQNNDGFLGFYHFMNLFITFLELFFAINTSPNIGICLSFDFNSSNYTIICLVLSLAQTFALFLVVGFPIITDRYTFFKGKWPFYVLLAFLTINLAASITLLDRFIFSERDQNNSFVFYIFALVISIIISSFGQFYLFWLAFGIPSKDPNQYHIYRSTLIFRIIAIFVFIFSTNAPLYTDNDILRKFFCGLALVSPILVMFLSVWRPVLFYSWAHDMNFSLSFLLLVIATFNFVQMFTKVTFQVYFFVSISLFCLAIIFTHPIHALIIRRKQQKVKKFLNTNSFSYYNKKNPKDIVYDMLSVFDSIQNYNYIDYVLGLHPDNFELLEVEYLIASKKNDLERMSNIVSDMSQIASLSFIDKTRRTFYIHDLFASGYITDSNLLYEAKDHYERYIYYISLFWNEIVVDKTDRLIPICAKASTSYYTLKTILSECNKNPAMKKIENKFNTLCPLKEEQDNFTSDSGHIDITANARSSAIISTLISHFQIYLCFYLFFIYIIALSITVGQRMNEIHDGYIFMYNFGEILTNYEAVLATLIANGAGNQFNTSILQQWIYDDSLFTTKFENYQIDAYYLIELLKIQIQSLSSNLNHFKYKHCLDSVFNKIMDYTTSEGYVKKVTLLSGIRIKVSELELYILNGEKPPEANPWRTTDQPLLYSYLAIVADSIYENMSSILKKDALYFGIAIVAVIIVFIIHSIIYGPAKSWLVEDFFSSLINLPKTEIVNLIRLLKEDYQQSYVQFYSIYEAENQQHKLKFFDDDYDPEISFLRSTQEKIQNQTSMSKRTNKYYIYLRLAISAFIFILLGLIMVLFSYIFYYKLADLNYAIKAVEYAQYLPIGTLKMAYTIIQSYNHAMTEGLDALPQRYEDVTPIINRMAKILSDGNKEILEFTNEIVNHSIYVIQDPDAVTFQLLSQTEVINPNSIPESTLFSSSSVFYVSFTLFYGSNKTQLYDSFYWAVGTGFVLASYFIPYCKNSLYQNEELYVSNLTSNIFMYCMVFIASMVIIAILAYSINASIPTPKGALWSCVATMPKEVYNDFSRNIDTTIAEIERKQNNTLLVMLFNDKKILNGIDTPLVLLDDKNNIRYMTDSIERYLKVDQALYYNKKLDVLIYDASGGDYEINDDETPYIIYTFKLANNKNVTIQSIFLQFEEETTSFGTIYGACVFFDISKTINAYVNLANAKNQVKILVAMTVPFIYTESLFDPDKDIDVLSMSNTFLSTWYLGNVETPEQAQAIKKCVRECLEFTSNTWITYHSTSTFRIFIGMLDNNTFNIAIRSLYMCLNLVSRLIEINVSPHCFISKANNAPGRFISENPPIFETLGGNSSNFIVSVLCPPNQVFVSRDVYEIVYNTDIEISYETVITLGQLSEVVYKVDPSAKKTIENDPHLLVTAKLDHKKGAIGVPQIKPTKSFV